MISANFHPHIGGSERQALELSRALQSAGWRVTVLTRHTDKSLPKEELLSGIRIKRLFAPFSGLLNAVCFMFSLFAEMLRTKDDYCAIHVHMASSPAVAAAFAGRLLKKPVFVKIAASRGFGDIATSRATLAGRLKLIVLSMLGPTLLIINKEMEEELKRSPVCILHTYRFRNGVDTAAYTQETPEGKERAKRGLSLKTGPVFLFAGRITAQKNLPAFLRAWTEQARRSPQAQLAIVGDGDKKAELEKLAVRLNAGDSVIFAGPTDDVRPWYAAADVFVLPSLAEGLSNSMLEAMACGLPVLASGVGGAADAIKNGESGFLFAPQDTAAMTEAINRFLAEPELAAKMGAMARKEAERHYAMSDVAREIAGLYLSAKK